MTKPQIVLLGLGAAMLLPILTAPVMRAKSEPAAPVYWKLLRETPMGDRFVEDYNQTIDDCAAAAVKLAAEYEGDEILCGPQHGRMR